MEISEGEGWRLVVDPERHPYPALIGGQDWAFELDSTELSSLRNGVLTLLQQHRDLLGCLMKDEQIELELDVTMPAGSGVESGPSEANADAEGSLFLALNGDARRWSLRFVLTPANGSRAVEGAWGTAASAALAAALERLDASELDTPPRA